MVVYIRNFFYTNSEILQCPLYMDYVYQVEQK